jgi:hypothetical protein
MRNFVKLAVIALIAVFITSCEEPTADPFYTGHTLLNNPIAITITGIPGIYNGMYVDLVLASRHDGVTRRAHTTRAQRQQINSGVVIIPALTDAVDNTPFRRAWHYSAVFRVLNTQDCSTPGTCSIIYVYGGLEFFSPPFIITTSAYSRQWHSLYWEENSDYVLCDDCS